MCSLAFLCRAPFLRRLWFGENRLCLLQHTSKRALLRNGGKVLGEPADCIPIMHRCLLDSSRQGNVSCSGRGQGSSLVRQRSGNGFNSLAFYFRENNARCSWNRDEIRTSGIRLIWEEGFCTSRFTLKTLDIHTIWKGFLFSLFDKRGAKSKEKNGNISLTFAVPEMHFCCMLHVANTVLFSQTVKTQQHSLTIEFIIHNALFY